MAKQMIAYLDLPSGVSGDMLLGCLIDAGWPVDELRGTIDRLKLPPGEWAVRVETVQKHSFRATQVDVLFEEGRHDRRLDDVRAIIESSDLPEGVRSKAIAVFTRLASAEAKVHGTSIDQVHFHEVGAIDAIIDVVGVVSGFHDLGVERIFASPLPLGPGWTGGAHGRIPLPAPATLELLAAVNAPTRPAPGPGELVTPTGAALLAELATFEQPAMRLSRIGVGAGQRDCPWPNVARLWLGEPEPSSRGGLVQLETNIDDMNPQLYPAVSDALFAAGAKDVWLTPIQMKKGRPGVLLGVLGPADREAALADVILRQTTTLGVRVHAIRHRHEARRELRTAQTPFGPVAVKLKWVGEELVGAAPEFDECRKLAEAAGVPVRTVHEAAAVAARAMLPTGQAPRP
jgi:pyridinium-3,5-bisthiocarboxylic acid mononucleotide nickel chelatase